MSLIGILVGGAIIGGIGKALYSDYSDHSDYDNYSDYSDAAERRERRRKALLSTVQEKKEVVLNYKDTEVNKNLYSKNLIEQDGATVSLDEVNNDALNKISIDKENESYNKCTHLNKEIELIDALLNRIDVILKEGE